MSAKTSETTQRDRPAPGSLVIGEGDAVAQALEMLEGEDVAAIATALDVLSRTGAEREDVERAIALALLSLRVPLPPELTGRALSMLGSLHEHVTRESLHAMAWPEQSDVELEAMRQVVSLTVDTAATLGVLRGRPALLLHTLEKMSGSQIARALPALLHASIDLGVVEDYLYGDRLCALLERAVESLDVSAHDAVGVLWELVNVVESNASLTRVVETLNMPWAIAAVQGGGVEVDAGALRSKLHQYAPLSLQIVKWSARTKRIAILRWMLHEDRTALQLRHTIIDLLARHGDRGALDEMIRLATTRPEDFNEPVFGALRVFHHRGIFVRREDLEFMLSLYHDTRGASPEWFAAITYVHRRELVELLSAIASEDERWRRFVSLLGVLEGVESLVVRLLERCPMQGVLHKLCDMVAARASQAYEEPLLGRLHEGPVAVTCALLSCGAQRSYEVFKELEEEGALWSLPLKAQNHALTFMWEHAPDARARDALLKRADAASIPKVILEDMMRGSVDEQALALMLSARTRIQGDEDAKARLESLLSTLGHHGARRHLCAIASLLFAAIDVLPDRQGQDVAQTPGAYAHDRSVVVLSESTLAPSIRAHITMFEQRITSVAPALMNRLLMQYIDERAEGASHHLRIALDALEQPLTVDQIATLKGLLWHDSAHVRKVALRVLSGSDDPGVLVRFYQSMGEHAPETLRVAIEALAKPGQEWAADAIACALDHRNMNIKRTAARALWVVGGASQAEAIVRWLGTHDNAGFREELVGALKASVGTSWRALIAARMAGERSGRARALLKEALGGERGTGSGAVYGAPERVFDPERQLDDLMWRAPSDVNHFISVLERIHVSAEFAAPHLSTLLKWAHDATFGTSRARVLDWVRLHLGSPTRAQRFELLRLLRALPVIPLTSDPVRLDLLESLDARVTASDRARCLEDARRATQPETILRATVERLLDVQRVSNEQSADRMFEAFLEDVHRKDRLHNPLLHPVHRAQFRQIEAVFVYRCASFPDDMLERLLELFIEAKPIVTGRGLIGAVERKRSAEELLEQLVEGETRRDRESAFVSLFWQHALSIQAKEFLFLRAIEDEGVFLYGERLLWTLLDDLQLDRRATKVQAFLAEPGDLAPRLISLTTRMHGSALTRAVGWMLPLWRAMKLEDAWRTSRPLEQLTRTLRRVDGMHMLARCIHEMEQGHRELAEVVGTPLVSSPLVERLGALPGATEHPRIEVLLDHVERAPLSKAPTDLHVFEVVSSQLEDILRGATASQPGAREDRSVGDLSRALQSEESGEVIQALRELKHERDEEIAGAIFSLLEHRSPRVRSTAYRTLRSVGSQAIYLRGAAVMLHDARREVRRSALKTIGFGGYTAAVDQVIALMLDEEKLRDQALETLALLGEEARKALIKRRARARPDRRALFDEALARLGESRGTL